MEDIHPGGLSGTEKAVRLVGQGSGKRMSPLAFLVFLWAGALTPFCKCPSGVGGLPRLRTGKGS